MGTGSRLDIGAGCLDDIRQRRCHKGARRTKTEASDNPAGETGYTVTEVTRAGAAEIETKGADGTTTECYI